MVWALVNPGGFGDFWPLGTFIGWREKVEQYFDAKMPEEIKSQYRNGFGLVPTIYKFTYEQGTPTGRDVPPVGPLHEDEWPDEYNCANRQSSLASFIALSNRMFAVDDRMRELLERLDPGVHHFRPIGITMTKKRDFYPKRYQIILIGRFMNSFAPDASVADAFTKHENYDSYAVKDTRKEYLSGLAFSSATIGNAHLWRERKLRNPGIFVSDALRFEIEKAGLRVPKLIQMKEVQS